MLTRLPVSGHKCCTCVTLLDPKFNFHIIDAKTVDILIFYFWLQCSVSFSIINLNLLFKSSQMSTIF